VTLLLNIFYAGKIAAMPAKLSAKEGAHTVIRPLLYCPEDDLIELANERTFPIIPCNLCGSQDNLKRRKMKELVAELHAENPKVKGNLMAALSNVIPSHLLDRALIDRQPDEVEDTNVGGMACAPAEPLIGVHALLRSPVE
jgi:tRNA 2-thiocytidine biosynthesis protein TtcA